ncbi:putative tRNA N6-adenosine threonylcarbamoyltransferase, mitochondrial [Trichinella spiralis]|uniref:N(6)-L-threonylcarbamoyladenine synthase n=1 Tax=Trichinella spiralis TaxID=6334 RepID=A0A0V1B811_TRISP|nr:putative tRNA N6-adenosine threonylcarbamoyltransferase, mitochondrial [Trichinella spiralis]
MKFQEFHFVFNFISICNKRDKMEFSMKLTTYLQKLMPFQLDVINERRFLMRSFSSWKCLMNRPLILGIETSCDDTGAAVVDGFGNILGEELSSQQSYSSRFGGVIPTFAKRQHLANVEAVVNGALTKSGITLQNLDAIAVTNKPGMPVCLRVGVDYATNLCRISRWIFLFFLRQFSLICTGNLNSRKPLIPVHHMAAHAFVVRLAEPRVQFPFLCLLMSGGHCILLLVKSVRDFLTLGNSLDIAPGEAFDKVGQQLKFECLKKIPAVYIFLVSNFRWHVVCSFITLKQWTSTSAAGCWSKNMPEVVIGAVLNFHNHYVGATATFHSPVSLPPLCDTLKSSNLQELVYHPWFGALSEIICKFIFIFHCCSVPIRQDVQLLANFCASFQHALFRHIAKRLLRAFQYVAHRSLLQADGQKCLVISGGVASNDYFRSGFQFICSNSGYELRCPPPELCTDNGTMIAWYGAEKYNIGYEVLHNLPDQIPISARDPLGEDVSNDISELRIAPSRMKFNF